MHYKNRFWLGKTQKISHEWCPEKWLKKLVPKKKYVPKFLKQRDIGNLCLFATMGPQLCPAVS